MRKWALYRGDWYLVLSYEAGRVDPFTGDDATVEGENQYTDIEFFAAKDIEKVEEDHPFWPNSVRSTVY